MLDTENRIDWFSRTTNLMVAIFVSCAAGVQWLVGDALARGAFGRTPAAVVFMPFLLWCGLGLAAIAYAGMFAIRRRAPIHAGVVTLIACGIGIWRAYVGVSGFLAVV